MSSPVKSVGREALFLDIYEQFRDKVYRLCLGYLADAEDVEDLIQIIFMNVWKGLDQFRGEAGYGTWLYRIAVNTCLLHLKQNRKKKNHTDLEGLKNHEDTSGLSIADREMLMDIRQAMKRLSDNDRLILTLSLEGLQYEEIAAVIGITTNHVGVKINRIKQQLKKMFNHESH